MDQSRNGVCPRCFALHHTSELVTDAGIDPLGLVAGELRDFAPAQPVSQDGA